MLGYYQRKSRKKDSKTHKNQGKKKKIYPKLKEKSIFLIIFNIFYMNF